MIKLKFDNNNNIGKKYNMLKICSQIVQKATSLTFTSQYNFGIRPVPRKIQNAHQRMKRYGKFPHIYKLITRMRPPNLRDSNLQFPLRIPIRYRHIIKPTKSLFVDNTKDIKWNRLSPNQILLAFQNFKYLEYQEIITGLQYLSKIPGQQNHDWNQHPWINQAFEFINKQFVTIKTGDLMKFYYLMKKLNCKNQQFWKKMYSKIQEQIYSLYPSDFQYLFMTYYKKADQCFSSQMKEKFLKLMQGRLREFKNTTILDIFQIFHQENRLNTYWLQNVFIPLFKTVNRKYNIHQIGQIFRFMMIVGHEHNDRLYDNLYGKIMKYQYKTAEQVELMQDIIGQIKQLFTSHRVQPYLQFLKSQKQRLKDVKQQKKLQLYQIVKQDLIFFMQKRKLSHQSSNQLNSTSKVL